MEIDCIHFWTIDADRALELLVQKMEFRKLDDRSNEHTREYLVGNAHLLFSIASPLTLDSPIAAYLHLHPSGVRDVSFRVPDLAEIRRRIARLGIKVLAGAAVQDDVQWVKIQGWGAIEHTIRQESSSAVDPQINGVDEPIIGIDHLVLNVGSGELALAVNWYRELFDFQVQQTFNIQTQTSGLVSQALVSACGQIRFNINEPSSTTSQIQEFLDLNHGAGIQHIAMQTNDILATVDRLQQQGLACLPIPQTYYVNLQNRSRIEQNILLSNDEWQQLERLQILMDWSTSVPEAILLQIFTQPIFEVPTFFFEIIERRNRAKGFGQGNFQALFEAIEEYHTVTLDRYRSDES